MSKLKLAFLTVLMASSATSAWAQKPKYTRTQDVKIDVKLSDRVKPIQTNPKPTSNSLQSNTGTESRFRFKRNCSIRAFPFHVGSYPHELK